MLKKCPNCGIEISETATFCANCGAKFEDIPDFEEPVAIEEENTPDQPQSQQNPESSSYKDTLYSEPETPTPEQNIQQTPYQPPPYMPQKQPKNKKTLIAIGAIAVVIILVLSILFVFFIDSGSKAKTDFDRLVDSMKTKVSGGPSVNLQSLSSGNFQTIPDINHMAKYGIYSEGERIGEAIEINTGTTTYNGKNCYKIIGKTEISMSYDEIGYSFSMDFVIDTTYYVDAANNIPVYLTSLTDSTIYYMGEPISMEMTTTITWDQDASTITTIQETSSELIGPEPSKETAIATLPEEYWGMVSSIDDLFVGFTREFDYTISEDETEEDVNLIFTVSKQEDVTVQAGTFNDCYEVDIDQEFGLTSMNIKVWISEDGNVPKAEYSMASLGIDIAQKLEGYYTS